MCPRQEDPLVMELFLFFLHILSCHISLEARDQNAGYARLLLLLEVLDLEVVSGVFRDAEPGPPDAGCWAGAGSAGAGPLHHAGREIGHHRRADHGGDAVGEPQRGTLFAHR